MISSDFSGSEGWFSGEGDIGERGTTDAGRDWGQEEKEMTEDEMAGWHH